MTQNFPNVRSHTLQTLKKTTSRGNMTQYQGSFSGGRQDNVDLRASSQFSSSTLRPVVNVTDQIEPFSQGYSYHNHPVHLEYLNAVSSNTEMSRSRSIPQLCSESKEGFRHWPSVPNLNPRQYPVSVNCQSQFVHSPPHHRGYRAATHVDPRYYNSEIEFSSSELAFGNSECLNSCDSSNEMLAPQPFRTDHGQENEVLMYKLMCQQKDRQLKQLEQQLSSTNNYLKFLPTTEQVQHLEKDCARSESDKDYIMKKYKELKRVFYNVKEDLRKKNLYIDQLENKNLRYQTKIGILNQYALDLNSGKDDNKENAVQERDNLLGEIKLLKKKMNNYERANDALQKKYSRDVEALRESLEEERNLNLAQKNELRYKEESILSLKAQMKEADAKRLHLMEDNLELEEKVKSLSLATAEAEERYTLEKKLFKELRVSVVELKAIAEIIEDQVTGGNPNMSLLLGNPALSITSNLIHGPTSKSIHDEINEAGSLNKHLSKLREDLSDKYAEHLGSQLKCLTQ